MLFQWSSACVSCTNCALRGRPRVAADDGWAWARRKALVCVLCYQPHKNKPGRQHVLICGVPRYWFDTWNFCVQREKPCKSAAICSLTWLSLAPCADGWWIESALHGLIICALPSQEAAVQVVRLAMLCSACCAASALTHALLSTPCRPSCAAFCRAACRRMRMSDVATKLT